MDDAEYRERAERARARVAAAQPAGPQPAADEIDAQMQRVMQILKQRGGALDTSELKPGDTVPGKRCEKCGGRYFIAASGRIEVEHDSAKHGGAGFQPELPELSRPRPVEDDE